MTTFVIDAGHGGTQAIGNSSPCGVVGPSGLREKDVTLLVARRLAPRLGGKTLLTRNRDENLALGRRAAIARGAGADVFLSIHANRGPASNRGAEVWVHERSGPASTALANVLARHLSRLGGRAQVRRGALAVLSPEHHARHTAACLLEIDYLSDPAGERRLRDPAVLDAIANQVADGTRGLGGRYGRTVALESEPTLDTLIPDAQADNKAIDFTVSPKSAVMKTFGADGWENIVHAGEQEMEKKLSDLLDELDRLPIDEEIKVAAVAIGALFLLELAPAGAGYYQANETVASRWARTGFAQGVVWAADDRKASEVRSKKYESMWTPYNLPTRSGDDVSVEFNPAQVPIARNCYRMGFIAGMLAGKALSTTQKFNLFADLQQRDTDPTHNWDEALSAAPGNRPVEFYWVAATLLEQFHTSED